MENEGYKWCTENRVIRERERKSKREAKERDYGLQDKDL